MSSSKLIECNGKEISLQKVSVEIKEKTGKRAKLLCDLSSSVQAKLLLGLDIDLIKSRDLPLRALLYGGCYQMYAERIYSIYKAFHHLGIELVFFVEVDDENTLQMKLSGKYNYLQYLKGSFKVQQLCKGQEETLDYPQWHPGRLIPLQILMALRCAVLVHRHETSNGDQIDSLSTNKVLEDHGCVDIKYCFGDTMPEIIKYVKSHDNTCGILSRRFHFVFASGCTLLCINSFDTDNTLGLKSRVINESPEDVKCIAVSPASLSEALGLQEEQLPDFAILLGNRFTRMFTYALPVLSSLGIEVSDSISHGIAEWLKGKEVPLLSSCTQVADFCSHHPEYQDAMEKSYSMYSGVKSESKVTPKSQLCSTLLEEASEKCVPRSLLTVAKTGIFWRPPSVLENLDLGQPTIFDMLLPVRKIAYLLLGLQEVYEFGRTSSKSFAQLPLKGICKDPSKSMQLVEDIRGMDDNEKLQVLFHLMTDNHVHGSCSLSDIEQVITKVMSGEKTTLSAQAVFACACLTLFVTISQKNNLCSEMELDAVLYSCLACCTCSLFPYRTSAPPSVQAITISSHFMETLLHAYYLAAIVCLSQQVPEVRNLFYPMMFVPLHACLMGTDEFHEIEIIRKAMQLALSYESVKLFKMAIFDRASLFQLVILFHSAVQEIKANEESLTQEHFEAQKIPKEYFQPSVESDEDDSDPDLPSPSQSRQYSNRRKGELPIHRHKQEIIELISSNKVTCIVGETGCGKSSQVPQFIIETAANCSQPCKIIVSQPNAIAAGRLARRVAFEMKNYFGVKVGCWSEDERRESTKTQLIYSTSKCLLDAIIYRRNEIRQFTHIILDEIHVRSVEDDFIVSLVRELLSEYPQIKVILMSATLQGDLFVKYFRKTLDTELVADPCFVGTMCYKVKTYFIDQLNELVKENQPYLSGKESVAARILQQLLEKEKQSKYLLSHPKVTPYTQDICTNLIISQMYPGESVLVFLPGIQDISDYYDNFMKELKRRQLTRNFHVFAFSPHYVPIEEQREIFERPPSKMIHVIIASRAAESSVTFRGLKMVINFGIRYAFEYSSEKRANNLTLKWCSRSSCTQREGRVGRVFDGIAVHLFTKGFYDTLPKFDSPEINTVPLSKTTLQAKIVCNELGISLPSQFLGALIEPPSVVRFEASLQDLTDCGALVYNPQKGVSEEAEITMLGCFCLSLQLDLTNGRLIFMGILLGCPLDAIVMAAALSMKQDVFTLPTKMVMGNTRQFQASLRRSIDSRFYFDKGSFSNLIMMRNLFITWLQYKYDHGVSCSSSRKDLARTFCQEHAVRAERLLLFEAQVVNIASAIKRNISQDSELYAQLTHLAGITTSAEASPCFYSPANPTQTTTSQLFSQSAYLCNAPESSKYVPSHKREKSMPKETASESVQQPKYIPPHRRRKASSEEILRFCDNNDILRAIIIAATPNHVICSEKEEEDSSTIITHKVIRESQLDPQCTVAIHMSKVCNEESSETSDDSDECLAEDSDLNKDSDSSDLSDASDEVLSKIPRYQPPHQRKNTSSCNPSEDPESGEETFFRKGLQLLVERLSCPKYSFKIKIEHVQERAAIGLVEVTSVHSKSEGKKSMDVSYLSQGATYLWQFREVRRKWEFEDIPKVIFGEVFHPCEIEWYRLSTRRETVDPVYMNWRNPTSLVCDLQSSPYPHLAIATTIIGHNYNPLHYNATSITILPPLPKSLLLVLAFQTLSTRVKFLTSQCGLIKAVKINSCTIDNLMLTSTNIIQINKLRKALSTAIELSCGREGTIPLSNTAIQEIPKLLWELLNQCESIPATGESVDSGSSISEEESQPLQWTIALPGIEPMLTVEQIMKGNLSHVLSSSGQIPCYPLYECSLVKHSCELNPSQNEHFPDKSRSSELPLGIVHSPLALSGAQVHPEWKTLSPMKNSNYKGQLTITPLTHCEPLLEAASPTLPSVQPSINIDDNSQLYMSSPTVGTTADQHQLVCGAFGSQSAAGPPLTQSPCQPATDCELTHTVQTIGSNNMTPPSQSQHTAADSDTHIQGASSCATELESSSPLSESPIKGQPYTEAHVTEYFRRYLLRNGPQEMERLKVVFKTNYIAKYPQKPTDGIRKLREKFFTKESGPFKMVSKVVSLKEKPSPDD